MPVVTLHGLKPEVKDARIVPVVVGGHCYPRTLTHRENKKNERPCSNATIDRSLSIEMKKRRKTTPMKRYNGFRRYCHARDTMLGWRSDTGISFGMLVLDETVRRSTREFGSHDVRQWCNRSIAIYWSPTPWEMVGQPCLIHTICLYLQDLVRLS